MRTAFFVLFIVCACNTRTGTNSASGDTAASAQTIHTNIPDTIVTGARPVALQGCYQMILKRDTANLRLNVKDSTVTGTLEYAFHEKDRNTGTVHGVLRGDVIYADYTFQSEGTTSVREVVFRVQGDALLQAFGDLTEQDGKVVFKDSARLQFQTVTPFLKVACP